MTANETGTRPPPTEGTSAATVPQSVYVSGSFNVTTNAFSQNWFYLWCPHLPSGMRRVGQFQNYPTTYGNASQLPANTYYAPIDPGLFSTIPVNQVSAAGPSVSNIAAGAVIHWAWQFSAPMLIALGVQPVQAPSFMNVNGSIAPFAAQQPLYPYGRIVDGFVTIISNAIPATSKTSTGTLFAGSISDFRQGTDLNAANLSRASLPESDYIPTTPIANGITVSMGPDVLRRLRPTLNAGFSNGLYSVSPSTENGVLAEYVIPGVQGFTSSGDWIKPAGYVFDTTVGFPLLSAFGPMYTIVGRNGLGTPAPIGAYSTATSWGWINPINYAAQTLVAPPNADPAVTVTSQSVSQNWGAPSVTSLCANNFLGGYWISPSMQPILPSSYPPPAGVTSPPTAPQIPLTSSVLLVAPISPLSAPYIEIVLGFQYTKDAFLPPLNGDMARYLTVGPFYLYHLYASYSETAEAEDAGNATKNVSGQWNWIWQAEMVSPQICALGASWPFLQPGNNQSEFQSLANQTVFATSPPLTYPYTVNPIIPGVGPYLANQAPLPGGMPPAPIFVGATSNIYPGNSVSAGATPQETVGATPPFLDRGVTLKSAPIQRSEATWVGCMLYNFDPNSHVAQIQDPTNVAQCTYDVNKTPIIPIITKVRFGSQDAADLAASTPARVIGVQGVAPGQQVLAQGQLMAQLIPSQVAATYSRAAANKVFTSSDEMMRVMGVYNTGGEAQRVLQGSTFNPFKALSRR